MNRAIVLFLALIVMLSISPTMSWAGEKGADVKTTTWQDIFSDVVGHYPLSADQANTSPEQKAS